ncbi:DNA methyltransferase [Flavobacterium soyangense]|uniref:site-specific DNA-methyltransferase (adenine-specific) n=1 Tax=Flavobacterium soyangense TaxID=2023265 RepID=A0A930XZC6_9FLAO|nr:DNA methyltransferase [Flavobacterium soyangense]MBF2707284.1 site-specific DNA-methyltransferase [Flavobacterium soyangense]
MITVTRENNMALMSRYPDNYFELAIVDPPYGILNKTKRGGDHKFNMEEYSQWDVKPNDEYFNELFRVSKNQIIWGGNYFSQIWLRSEYNKGFIIWDKNQPESLNNFSMAEMAWSSLDKPSKIFRYSVRKNRNKIHPTQKPIELYEWLLKMYAKKGDKILDTHLGSGTIAIACYNAGLSLTACEISESYFLKSLEKISESIPENLVQKNLEDAYSILFPNQIHSENEKHDEYKEQIYQLMLFNESKAKFNLTKVKPKEIKSVKAV